MKQSTKENMAEIDILENAIRTLHDYCKDQQAEPSDLCRDCKIKAWCKSSGSIPQEWVVSLADENKKTIEASNDKTQVATKNKNKKVPTL